MPFRLLFIFPLLLLLLVACATPVPRWKQESLELLDKVRERDADKLFGAEFRSAEESLVSAEARQIDGEYEQAENLFRLSFMKLSILDQKLVVESTRRSLEAEQRREEAEKIANERIKAHEEELRIAEERKAAEAARLANEISRHRSQEKARAAREKPLVSSYTVSRGETLPLIAAHPEVYGDRNLWPLIYRANRDQIGDPRHIWPGQVLRIKRNQSREELMEARRFAQTKSLH